jgi:hypothetical protein
MKLLERKVTIKRRHVNHRYKSSKFIDARVLIQHTHSPEMELGTRKQDRAVTSPNPVLRRMELRGGEEWRVAHANMGQFIVTWSRAEDRSCTFDCA